MNILIINQFNQSEVIETNSIPRVGVRIDLFETPAPTVVSVLLFPQGPALKGFINAVVTVE